MKPALSPATTAVLPTRASRASTSSTTEGSVTTVRTTSTRPITGAGLNQCMPSTRAGREVATANSVTDNDEVLVASTASAGQFPLGAQPLRDGFNDHLYVGQLVPGRGDGDPPQHGGALLLGELAPRHRPAGRVLEALARPRDAGLVDLHAHDIDAEPGQNLCNAGTHRAEPDHSDLGELPRHDRSFSPPADRDEAPAPVVPDLSRRVSQMSVTDG